MKSQENRDMITDLYRIYETFEEIPTGVDAITDYFKKLYEHLKEYNAKHHNPVAYKLALGLLEGLSDLADIKGRQSYGK